MFPNNLLQSASVALQPKNMLFSSRLIKNRQNTTKKVHSYDHLARYYKDSRLPALLYNDHCSATQYTHGTENLTRSEHVFLLNPSAIINSEQDPELEPVKPTTNPKNTIFFVQRTDGSTGTIPGIGTGTSKNRLRIRNKKRFIFVYKTDWHCYQFVETVFRVDICSNFVSFGCLAQTLAIFFWSFTINW